MRSAIACLIVGTAQGTEVRRLQVPTACSDDCGTGHASNGLCEDGGPGSVWPDCVLGTDCSDCGVREVSPSPPAPISLPAPSLTPSNESSPGFLGCSDACGASDNGLCEDGGPGSVWQDCPLGTDCTDCGVREYTSSPPAPPSSPAAPPVDDSAFPWAVAAIILFACAVCGALCAFAWLVRDRELKGESIFRPRGRRRFKERAGIGEVGVQMDASEVVMPTPLEAELQEIEAENGRV